METNSLDLLMGKKPEPVEAKVQVEENPVEEPQEPQEEPVVEATPEIPTEAPVDWVSLASKNLGMEIGSAAELKTIVEKSKTLETELKEWESKYTELKQAVETAQDPLSFFANEKEYMRQQLIKQNPELNKAKLNELFDADLKAIKPEEALIMNIAINEPDLSVEDIREMVLTEYGYDPEVDTKIPPKLLIESKKAIKELDKLKNSVEIPKKVDFEAARKEQIEAQQKQIEKAKSDLEPIVKKLSESLNDLELSDGKDAYFKYQFEPEFKSEISKMMMDYLVSSGAKIDENTEKYLSEARAFVDDVYFLKNRKRIMDAYAAQKVAEKDEEWRKKVHNPKPITETPLGADGKPQDTDLVAMVSK